MKDSGNNRVGYSMNIEKSKNEFRFDSKNNKN